MAGRETNLPEEKPKRRLVACGCGYRTDRDRRIISAWWVTTARAAFHDAVGGVRYVAPTGYRVGMLNIEVIVDENCTRLMAALFLVSGASSAKR